MAISRSPSLTSLVSPKPRVGSIWGSLANLFSPRGTPRPSETQESRETDPEVSSQTHEESQTPAPHSLDPPPATLPLPPSQIAESSQPLPSDSQVRPAESPPIFIARDFAYEPKPEIVRRPVDPKWVVPLELPEHELPGLRKRLAQEWEASHSHLYRLHGNRADPPNTIPKTWGGRSKAEDDALMQQARERLAAMERARRDATAFGLTPTEPNLGGPPPASPLPEYAERDALARADAYQWEQETRALAAGLPPLVKTPPNSPPPPGGRRRGLPPPPLCVEQAESQPLHPPLQAQPRTPPPPPPQSKRKFEELDSESEKRMTRARRRRRDEEKEENLESDSESERRIMTRARRRCRDEEEEDVESEPTASRRYALRQRFADGTTNAGPSSPKSSPKGKGKGKGKAPAR